MEVYPWLRLVVVVGRALFQQKLGSFYFSNASTSSSFSFHVLILQQSYVLSLYRGIPHSSNKRSCAISGRWRFSHAISLSLSLSLHLLRSFFFSLFFRESSFDAISIMHGAVGTVGGKGPPYLREALRTLLPWTLHYFLLRSHTFDQWPDRSSLGLGSAHAYKLVHCFFFSVFSSFLSSFVFFVSSGLSAISEPTVSPLVHAPNPELFFDRNTKEKNVQKERRGKRQTVQTRKEL